MSDSGYSFSSETSSESMQANDKDLECEIKQYFELSSKQEDTTEFSNFLTSLNKQEDFKKIAKIILLKDNLFKPVKLKNKEELNE